MHAHMNTYMCAHMHAHTRTHTHARTCVRTPGRMWWTIDRYRAILGTMDYRQIQGYTREYGL